MNKMQILSLIPIALLLSGCTLVAVEESGNVITQSREVSNIEEVEICCGMKLRLTQGDQEQLTLEAEDNLMSEIETTVSGKRLIVNIPPDLRPNIRVPSLRPNHPIIVHLQMKTIHGIEVSGGGSLEIESIHTDHIIVALHGGSNGTIGDLQATSADLDTSGGGTIEIDTLATDTLNIDADGGSHITIDTGTVTEQQITGSGASQYDAIDVESEITSVDLSGGSEANVWVTESLNVKASGASHVEYRGNPSIDQQLTGGSDLRTTDRS